MLFLFICNTVVHMPNVVHFRDIWLIQCSFPLVGMAVPISPVLQHTPVLEMEQPWWQEQDFLTKTWSLSSFIQQVFLQEKFFLQKRIYIITSQFLQHDHVLPPGVILNPNVLATNSSPAF